MKRGFLSQYFKGIAMKRLSAVEVNSEVSNQHEFNGLNAFKHILGSERRDNYPATFLWFGLGDDREVAHSTVTWYDARKNHPSRSEYRLYYKADNRVMKAAATGDLLIIAVRPDDSLFLMVVKAESTIENQLVWLFNMDEVLEGERFKIQSIQEEKDTKVDYVVRYILEELGIEVEEEEDEELHRLLSQYYDTGFPSTATFSALARQFSKDVSALEDPDHALITWMNSEEKMFKFLERRVVAKRLELGFLSSDGPDVDSFIKFSLSVQNRRKSRVGHALENHVQAVFDAFNLGYARNRITENNSKPDFLFPSLIQYHDSNFPAANLTMLGVKSTCKDRWRQVLAEAARIETKHLLTLEPGISENQTREMRNSNLQLVLPKRLHNTYKSTQREWLLNLMEFIELLRAKA